MKPLVHQKKSLVLILVNTNFCLGLHYNADNSYLFVNGKEIYKFKADNKNVNFPTQFSLESMPNRFSVTESREAFLSGVVYSIDKSDTLNIKYLMIKNKIK